ncbi:acyl-CoA thioesterase [Christiangramia aquimixticola]|uniref:acyl-CoA thioesterase n=1 Tax=Christiangramia aquimixticola TaxID=1697558 RepID=UPI003AA9834A
MNHSDYKLSLDLRIDWSDLDMYEHVNNLTFMRFLQSGRVNFWEATGIHEYFKNSRKGTMLVSSHCDFKNSLYYPGTATVKTKLAETGNSSFALKHIILNDKEEICAEGKDVVVCYDFENKTTFRIPDWLRETISKY